MTKRVDKEFGQYLKELRKQSDFTQAEVATGIKISGAYVAKIEAGQVPSLEILELLAKVYSVDLDDLRARAGMNAPSQRVINGRAISRRLSDAAHEGISEEEGALTDEAGIVRLLEMLDAAILFIAADTSFKGVLEPSASMPRILKISHLDNYQNSTGRELLSKHELTRLAHLNTIEPM